jgi:hypothetical protein
VNNGKKLLGATISLLAAIIAIAGVSGLGIYMIMLVVWFHMPILNGLTLVVPLILITLAFAWLCDKAGVALRQHSVQ